METAYTKVIMGLCNTQCIVVVFVMSAVVLASNTLGPSRNGPCQSPQFAELGQEGVIRCNIPYEYHGFYWYIGNVPLDNNPALRYESTKKTGYGYPDEFDCTNDGSLILKNVTLRHDNVFKILILKDDLQQRSVYSVNLTIAVTPNEKFPIMKRDNDVVLDYVHLRDNDSLVCIVKVARPPSQIAWFQAMPHEEREITSTEDISFTDNNNVSYDSSKTVTLSSNHGCFLQMFMCKSSGPGYDRIKKIVVDFDRKYAGRDMYVSKVVQVAENDTVSIKCVANFKPTLIVWKKELRDQTFKSIALVSTGNVTYLADDWNESYDVKSDGTLVIYEFTYEREYSIYRCIYNSGSSTKSSNIQLISLGATDMSTQTTEPDKKNTLTIALTVGIVLLIMGVCIIVLLLRRLEFRKTVTINQQIDSESLHDIPEKGTSTIEGKDVSTQQSGRESREENEEQPLLISTQTSESLEGEEIRRNQSLLQKDTADCEHRDQNFEAKPVSKNLEIFEEVDKLTYQQFIEVGRDGVNLSTDPSIHDLEMSFLSRIMAFDNQAISVFFSGKPSQTLNVLDDKDSNVNEKDWYTTWSESPESISEKENECSALDLVLTLITKCDMFLRQRVLERMAACNLAVPVLFPKPGTTDLIFFDWGLRSITKMWKSNQSEGLEEEYVLCSHFPTALFITLGDTEESYCTQSEVLNKVLAIFQENVQSVFFISREQDCGHSQLSDGLVECVWLIPKQSANTLTNVSSLKPVSYIHLRGNAFRHDRQMKYTIPMADKIIAFVHDFADTERARVLHDLKSENAEVFFFSFSKNLKFKDEQNIHYYNVEELGEHKITAKVCDILKDLIQHSNRLPLRPSIEKAFHGTDDCISSEKLNVADCCNAELIVREILDGAHNDTDLVQDFWEKAFKLKGYDFMLHWLELLLHTKYSIENITRFLVNSFGDSSEEERNRVAKIGARILISGQPLELVQGDTYSVSIDWITEVLEKVVDWFELQNARIFVTSVIGVQSSGKSNLLNTMFNSRFSVSSGCCTKGVQFQIFRMSQSQGLNIKSDFLAVIDTEGIYGSGQKTFNLRERQLNLTAFTMLISDLVLVNIAGETMENDTANIVVHAAEKVGEVTDHKLLARMIHQLVSDPKAKNFRMNEIKYLRSRLVKKDKNNVTKGNNIIIDEESYFFPPLMGGCNVSRSKDFCEMAFQLKSSITKIMGAKSGHSTVVELTERISLGSDRFIKRICI